MTAAKKNPGAGGRRGFGKARSLWSWAQVNRSTIGCLLLLAVLLAAVLWQGVAR